MMGEGGSETGGVSGVPSCIFAIFKVVETVAWFSGRFEYRLSVGQV
jgi:hypothetical protein